MPTQFVNALALAFLIIAVILLIRYVFKHTASVYVAIRSDRNRHTESLVRLTESMAGLNQTVTLFVAEISSSVKTSIDSINTMRNMVETLERPTKAIEDMPKMLLFLAETCKSISEEQARFRTLIQRDDDPYNGKRQSGLVPFDRMAGSDEQFNHERVLGILKIKVERNVTFDEAEEIWVSENDAVGVNPSSMTEA